MIMHIYIYTYTWTGGKVEIEIQCVKHVNILSSNVDITIVNHPLVITIDCWHKLFPNGWLIFVIITHIYSHDKSFSELDLANLRPLKQMKALKRKCQEELHAMMKCQEEPRNGDKWGHGWLAG